LDFSVTGGKKQRHGSALIGAGVTGCRAPDLKTANHLEENRFLLGGTMALTKSEIVAAVHELGFTKKKSVDIIETLLGIIKGSLEKNEDVLISGFGKFCVKEKNQRRGRNPATGDDLILRERKVVTFKCSGKLRKKINGYY
jgi:integration host factor subunit alpha